MTDTALAVRNIKKIDRRIAALTAEREGFAQALRDLGPSMGTGKHVTPNGSFTISENNTYPVGSMEAVLLPGQRNLCFKPRALDPAKVKALFPAVYASAKVHHGFKVTVS